MPFTSDLAVDGQYTDLTWYGEQCAVSDFGLTAEWRVGLGRVKNIHHVLIQHAGKSKVGIIYFKITYYYLNESMLY